MCIWLSNLWQVSQDYSVGKAKSLQKIAGKIGQPHAKEWNWTTLLHHTQKWIQNGLKTWNHETPRRKYREHRAWWWFFESDTKSKSNKSLKINKWDYIILKIFCTTKETINKINSQHTKLEKILASRISNKGTISKI